MKERATCWRRGMPPTLQNRTFIPTPVHVPGLTMASAFSMHLLTPQRKRRRGLLSRDGFTTGAIRSNTGATWSDPIYVLSFTAYFLMLFHVRVFCFFGLGSCGSDSACVIRRQDDWHYDRKSTVTQKVRHLIYGNV